MVNKVAGNGVGGKINRFIDKVFWFYFDLSLFILLFIIYLKWNN
jgi:hypothetical protein